MNLFARRLALLGSLFVASGLAQAQVSLTALGTPQVQAFDTLPASGSATWTNNATLPGWFHARTGTGTTIVANNGSSNGGNLYSYGTGTTADRALGSLGSGNAAVGSLFWGVRLQNNTGATITQLTVSYAGEQWRNSAAAAQSLAFSYVVGGPTVVGSLAEFQSPGTAVPLLDFTSPVTAGTAGALDGNAAANRRLISHTITGLNIPAGTEVMLRWSDPDHAGSDHGLAIDDLSITAQGGAATPTLSVGDVTSIEGSAPGTSIFSFAVTVSSALHAGITFDISTADGTAQDGNPAGEDNDYVARALSGQSIPAGQAGPYTFEVAVNRDTAFEGDETFFVNLSNVAGANVGDAQGLGTIQNDDSNATAATIAQIQGSGLASPMAGNVVVTEGIVTAQKFNNGFFMQTATAEVDADPATSEGIFVFTSAAPPASASVGNRVRVTATVTEFTPGSDLNQLPITELVSPTVQLVSTGNPLPAPVLLTSADFGAAANPGTAEKFEGMRVAIAEARVVEASGGTIDENDANATTNGVFQVVLADVARPFREPGIGVLDAVPIPAGKNPPLFDTNQERLMVRSRGQVGAAPMAIDVDAVVSNMVGVLDYFSGTWALLPDVGSGVVAGGKLATAVPDPADGDVTIGGFNLLRFFDEVNDRNGAVTLTPAALEKRLAKTGRSICESLKTPDILGVVEVENLRVLGMLADRINADCPTAPAYVPYLVNGNDVGGINVGFLVSNRSLGMVDRVEVLEVVQYGKDTLTSNPDGSTSLLNDRPPLLLRAIIHGANGGAYPVTVVVNHLRSLNGIDDTAPGSGGWPTQGDRVRAKRAQQALFLADLVHARQTANPSERIVLVGDFNAFEFNDGYADVMGIVRGDEVREDQVLTYADSPITTPLVDGGQLIEESAQRYSYVFEGSAQTLDHVVVNEALLLDPAVVAVAVEHARINADFGVHHYGNAGNVLRVSDHDPVRLTIRTNALRSADLSISASVDATAVPVGSTAVFRAQGMNGGPSAAPGAVVSLLFDALVEVSVGAPAGWSCAAPVQDASTTTVACTTADFAAAGTADFTATVRVTTAIGDRPLRMTATIASGISDPVPGNNTASAQTLVGRTADLSVAWSRQVHGPNLRIYALALTNAGPDTAREASVLITVDAPFGSVTWFEAPAGWTCARRTAHSSNCSTASVQPGDYDVFKVGNTGLRTLPEFRVTAQAEALTPDPDTANNRAVAP